MTDYEVRPIDGPLDAVAHVPGSKSDTIRSLACAALAEGRSHLYRPLVSEDSAAMLRVLTFFGVAVEASSDPWIVDGSGGRLEPTGEVVNVGESGLTGRIAVVLAALAHGSTVLEGRGRLPERPFAGLVEALRTDGVEISYSSRSLPMSIAGKGGLWGGPIEVDCSETTQFATALMIGAPVADNPVVLSVNNVRGSEGYLDVTKQVMGDFGAEVVSNLTGFEIANGGYRAIDRQIEPDASAATYPMVAAAITGGTVTLPGLSSRSLQPDVRIARHLGDMGCQVSDTDKGLVVDAADLTLRGVEADLSESPDGALALSVAAAFATTPSRLDGLHSLRLKESDRLAAIGSELSKIGATVKVVGDSLIIEPGGTRSAEIDSHGDHRIAMSLALVGLVQEGIVIRDAGVVAKTWPDYWERLDAKFEHVDKTA